MYKVILVDDEIWALSGIRKIFKWDKYGFEVIGEYTSGEEALEAILNQKVDVVFTDIQMDNFSGIDLMKDVAKRKKIKFVVVSAFPKFEYAQSAMKYGACEYCIKPVSLERADV
ncbi:MAG: response regulator [Clostridia bacterium]|nr:response regulator [Clostridia bacterium]